MTFAQVTLTDQSGRTLMAQAADHSTITGDFVRDVPGWYDGVSSDVETLDRITAGVMVASSRLAARVFSVVGYSVRDTDTEAAEAARHLSALFSDGGAADGHVEAVHDGRTLTCFAQRTGAPTVTLVRPRKRVEWTIPFVAADPHLYGPARTMQLRPVDTGAGFVWPGFADGFADWGVLGGDEAQLTNAGNAAALPTVTVTVDDGSGFRLSSGARSVEWVGACSRSVPVVVDMAGRVLVGGVDRSAQLVRREWLSVPPRGVVSMSLSTLSGGGGSAIATVRDTWI